MMKKSFADVDEVPWCLISKWKLSVCEKLLKVGSNKFEDIMTINSLYRPGPLQSFGR